MNNLLTTLKEWQKIQKAAQEDFAQFLEEKLSERTDPTERKVIREILKEFKELDERNFLDWSPQTISLTDCVLFVRKK
jgi:hypothetical protein